MIEGVGKALFLFFRFFFFLGSAGMALLPSPILDHTKNGLKVSENH